MNNGSQKYVPAPKLDIEDDWPGDVKTAVSYISTHLFNENLSISKLKQECKVNGKSFSARFKLATGYHPKEYILKHRIEASKKCTTSECRVRVYQYEEAWAMVMDCGSGWEGGGTGSGCWGGSACHGACLSMC